MSETESVAEERYELARGRLRGIPGESDAVFAAAPEFGGFFASAAQFLTGLFDEADFLREGGLSSASLEELQRRNRKLYEDILSDRYGQSWCNPDYAASRTGREYGRLLSALFYELRSAIPHIYMGEQEHALIRAELFLEIYGTFETSLRETGKPPAASSIRRDIAAWLTDYARFENEYWVRVRLIGNNEAPAIRLIRSADLSDPRCLYAYGAYIGPNQTGAAEYLRKLPEAEIARMADTLTEGFRRGFLIMGKDLGRNKYYSFCYPIGFERILRRAAENLDRLGLTPTTFDDGGCLFFVHSLWKNGWTATDANPQCTDDHSRDLALFLDGTLKSRMLRAREEAYRKYHDRTVQYAGPVVLEAFGDAAFTPKNCENAACFDAKQEQLTAAYSSRAALLYADAVEAASRSFTIMDLPLPSIAADPDSYGRIFRAVMEINTLDNAVWEKVQATIIASLDRADTVHVTGMNGNRTDITVNLWKLADPEHETIFENCVADVNIPVGEVFTTPVLKGTNGVLHVKRVYIEGLDFRDLTLTFTDGRVTDYGCANFDDPAMGRRFIEENILHHHAHLPMGEFAIGTNTTAYEAGRRLGIEDRLPILIAEKTGPHFAVGDTCYDHDEDNETFNPDGKRIVARENEISALRREDPEKAYFGCHTDITIPYDELGSLEAVTADGGIIPILRQGRFVLPGTEILNGPLD
jgi:aminopeptidase